MTSLGSEIQQTFAQTTRYLKGEINLFRALCSTFNTLRNGILAEEYHGARSHVCFKAMRGAGRSPVRCELADLLLITYRINQATSIRLTWLQAKVTTASLHFGTLGKASKTGGSFSANLEQWDLLANRPTIWQATNAFVPPPDLLSSSILPSVGSFGVFYPSRGGFDMAYFVANMLSPLCNNASANGKLCFQSGSYNVIRKQSGYDEITSCCCLFGFGDAVEREFVGTPVASLLSSGSPMEMATRRDWMRSLLLGLVAQQPQSMLPENLLELLGLSGETFHAVPCSQPPARAVVILRYGDTDQR